MVKFRVLVPACLLAFLWTSTSHGQAPAPMYGITPANTNVSPYVGILSDPFVRWQIPHDGGQIDNPALILDSRGVLFAQSLAPVFAATGLPAGINIPSWRDSTPAIDRNGNIYQWWGGRVQAYSPSGSLLWEAPRTNSTDGKSIKIGPDGIIYCGAGNTQMYAYSTAGNLLWTAPGYGSSSTPPAIDGNGNLYMSSSLAGGRYSSYDRDGRLRWTAPWRNSSNYYPPILGPDGNLYVSEYYGTRVYALDAATGTVLRQQDNLFGGIQAISGDGTLYSCSYQRLTATDLFGHLRWEARIPSSMFFQDLVVDAAGKVYCTTEENQLFAFSTTGEQLWMLQLPATGWQTLSPIIGPDGTLYVQCGSLLMAIGGTVPGPGGGAVILTALGLFGTQRRRGTLGS